MRHRDAARGSSARLRESLRSAASLGRAGFDPLGLGTNPERLRWFKEVCARGRHRTRASWLALVPGSLRGGAPHAS